MYVGKALQNGIFDLSRRCGFKPWPSSFQEFNSTLLVSENDTKRKLSLTFGCSTGHLRWHIVLFDVCRHDVWCSRLGDM